jgi:hypothetical protein
MGTDCRVYLYPSAKIDDVAKVMGALAGCEVASKMIGGTHGKPFPVTEVKEAEAVVSTMPEMSCIRITGGKAKEWGLWPYWHWEPDRPPFRGARLIMMRSTAQKVALAKRLVDFFGGVVDYNDCDSSDNDYSKPERKGMDKSINKNFHALQAAMLEVKPVTEKEIKAAAKWAAY